MSPSVISSGIDQKLYYHVIDPSTGVTTKNQAIGIQTGYGNSLTAVNNHVDGYYMLYTTRYSAGVLTLVGIRMSYNATAQTWTAAEYNMYTVSSPSDKAEIKVDVVHNQLVLATFDKRAAWFGGMRQPVFQTFDLGAYYRVADIGGNPPHIAAQSFTASTSNLQFEMEGSPNIAPASNYEGLTINPAYNLNFYYGSRHDVYLSNTTLTKGVDQNLYYVGEQGRSLNLSETNPYSYSQGSKLGPEMWSVPPYTALQVAKPYAYYPVQVLNVYAKAKAKATENLYTRHVGSKAYELSDHLGNVTVTLSDLKRELPNIQLASYGISAPLGVNEVAYAAQVLSYSNYYAFGMNMVGCRVSIWV